MPRSSPCMTCSSIQDVRCHEATAAMLVRVKRVGPHWCIQVVRNRCEDRWAKQTVFATLGQLATSGAVDRLLRSGARLPLRLIVRAESAGAEPDTKVASIGPAAVFERLWRKIGCRAATRSPLARPPAPDRPAAGTSRPSARPQPSTGSRTPPVEGRPSSCSGRTARPGIRSSMRIPQGQGPRPQGSGRCCP